MIILRVIYLLARLYDKLRMRRCTICGEPTLYTAQAFCPVHGRGPREMVCPTCFPTYERMRRAFCGT